MRVSVGHRLVGHLRRGVQADRRTHVAADAERNFVSVALDRRTGRENKVRHLVLPASLEHVEKPNDVAAHICPRILYRIPHPRLRRQMHDNLRRTAIKQAAHRSAILQITPDERKIAVLPQYTQSALFQPHVIIIVEVVEPSDGASRKSSVPGLKVKPRTATFSVSNVISLQSAFLNRMVF